MNLPARVLAALPRWILLAVVFLAAAEVFVRVDQRITWGAPLVGPWSNEQLTVRDSLGLHGRPGYRFEKWQMNNEGFRGPDMRVAIDPGKTRVAVLGASETFGLYETEGKEYPAQLRSTLDSLSPGRYDVVNVALAGMSLSAMVPYYRSYVERLHPQYVFLYLSPSFYLEVNPLPPMSQAPEAQHRPAQPSRGPVVESRLLAKSRDVLKETIPVWVVTAYREWSLKRRAEQEGPNWTWETVPSDRMEILKDHLDHLVAAIVESGARPILVTHTNRFVGMTSEQIQQDQRHLVNLRAVYYPRASNEVMVRVDSAANAMVREVAAARHVAVVEVEGKIPSGGEYFADYAHFTNLGAERMAHLLAGELLTIDSTHPVAP